MMSFCRILRHISVMFSTTTGVFIFTAIKNRLRAENEWRGMRVGKHQYKNLANTDKLITIYLKKNKNKQNILRIYLCGK